jgi:hypothetical protein
MNKIQESLELVTASDCAAIAALDASKLSSKEGDFVKLNQLNYYLLINTWLYNVKEYSEYGWRRLFDLMAREGLISAIKHCQDMADFLISERPMEECPSGIGKEIARNIRVNLPGRPTQGQPIGQDVMATQLFVLRYPKRFSPLLSDKVGDASLTSFLNIENRSKLLQRRGYSRYVLDYVREAMRTMVKWPSLCKEIRRVINDPFDLTFTSGVGSDSSSSLGSKLMSVSRE